MNHIVLVPISFETRNDEPIRLAMDLARDTRPEKVFVVCDDKGESLAATEQALGPPENRSDVELIVVRARDTGVRWGMGLAESARIVQSEAIDARVVLCMPGDPDPGKLRPIYDEFVKRLQALLAMSQAYDLTIGDYSILNDPIKETWDDFHTVPFIGALYPEAAVALTQRSISKLRSEFFVLKLQRIGNWIEPTDFPSDPTPFMINIVLRHRGSIGVAHMGDFSDEDPGRTGIPAKVYQSVRLALEMAVAHAAHEREESRRLGETIEEQLARTQILRARLKGLFHVLDNGIQILEQTLATPVEANPKIHGQNWAPVQGFSYLFESRESHYETYDSGIVRLRVTPEDGLLGRLASLSKVLALKLYHHTFQALPPDSFHVTGRDVVCDLDLPDLSDKEMDHVGQLLAGLPGNFRLAADELQLPWESREVPPITFRAGKLEMWRGSIIVMTLVPADDESANRLSLVCDQRERENAAWAKIYGGPNYASYTPHVTLGYWRDIANGRVVKNDSALLELCQSSASDIVGNTTLTVDRWTLHAFLNMATFIKVDQSSP